MGEVADQPAIWSEKRPSRIKVTWVHAKRISRWRRNSSPYISGDLFSDNSDISVYPPKYRGQMPTSDEIKEANVIFCPSHQLEEFFKDFGATLRAKVIICGNSDFEFHTIPSQIPSSVRQLFLQNSFISDHELITTLPIGIENFRWGVNGNPKFIKKTRSWASRDNKVLVGPFGLTHPTRIELLRGMRLDQNLQFVEERLSPKQFALWSNSFKYIAAVRGNGVDTHRFWESLYRGAIPIVHSDQWSKSLRSLELPFIEIREWSSEELQTALDQDQIAEFNPKELKPLWWPYWEKEIGKYL